MITRGTRVHGKPEHRESVREALRTRVSAGGTQRSPPRGPLGPRRHAGLRAPRSSSQQTRFVPRVWLASVEPTAGNRRRGLWGRKLLPVCSELLSVSSYVKSEKETKEVNSVGYSALREPRRLRNAGGRHTQAEGPAWTGQVRGMRESRSSCEWPLALPGFGGASLSPKHLPTSTMSKQLAFTFGHRLQTHCKF